MIAILRTNNYDEGYRIVKVIKNPISEKNHLAHVEYNGKEWMTGGILCEVHPATIRVLNSLSHKEQWEWLKSIKDNMYKL